MTTVCATGSAHTLLSHAHFVCAHPHIFMRAHSRMAQCHEKGLLHAHVVDLHLAFSILMFHPPSLLFPDGHFETTFPTSTSTTFLPSFTRPKSAGQAHFHTSTEGFGFLAKSGPTTGYEPKEFDKITSVEGDTTPINDPDHGSV